jgi:hypothetical protein
MDSSIYIKLANSRVSTPTSSAQFCAFLPCLQYQSRFVPLRYIHRQINRQYLHQQGHEIETFSYRLCVCSILKEGGPCRWNFPRGRSLDGDAFSKASKQQT